MNKVVKILVPAALAFAVCACGQKKPAQDPMMMGMGDQIPKVVQSVIDFISNMTDLYAVQLYKDLRGID